MKIRFPWIGYGVALLTVSSVLALKVLLHSFVGEEGPFLLFFAAVTRTPLFDGAYLLPAPNFSNVTVCRSISLGRLSSCPGSFGRSISRALGGRERCGAFS